MEKDEEETAMGLVEESMVEEAGLVVEVAVEKDLEDSVEVVEMVDTAAVVDRVEVRVVVEKGKE